ncbi:ATP-binding protein [Pseudomonas nitroreducens]|uniref:ATP-binding protein n=1 Tax=Pseudomonas nitroreducens TaxID=46680 RepID=UPI0002E8DF0A|nr:ATP-binding protein [Pseudomonas nitroreducens]
MASNALNLEVCDLERRFGIVSKSPAKCDKHGEYAAIFRKGSDVPGGCPDCSAEARAEKDREEQAEMWRKQERAMMEKRLAGVLIPARFQGRSFDTYVASNAGQKKALKVCREYAENFEANAQEGRCLLLLGKPGTGKTHLANAIAGHVVCNSRSVTAAYRTVSTILQLIKSSFDKNSEYNEMDALEALCSPSLLIIDEVGATKPTEFELATLFNVIDGRYQELLPTIIVSNLMPNELGTALGERCVDRLRENGGIALVFDWDSARVSK